MILKIVEEMEGEFGVELPLDDDTLSVFRQSDNQARRLGLGDV